MSVQQSGQVIHGGRILARVHSSSLKKGDLFCYGPDCLGQAVETITDKGIVATSLQTGTASGGYSHRWVYFIGRWIEIDGVSMLERRPLAVGLTPLGF